MSGQQGGEVRKDVRHDAGGWSRKICKVRGGGEAECKLVVWEVR